MRMSKAMACKPKNNTKWLCSMLAEMVAKSDDPIDSRRVASELLISLQYARLIMHRVAVAGDAEVYLACRLFICQKGRRPSPAKHRDTRHEGKRFLHHDIMDLLMTTPKRSAEVYALLPGVNRSSVDSSLSRLVARGEVKAIKTKGENWRRYVLA